MANYTKSTNFAIKDSLISGDPAKVVKGTEIDIELTNIQSAVNSKRDSSSVVPVSSGGTGATSLTGLINLATDVSNTLPAANGGTGQTTYTNGQLLIGNTATNGLSKATLTAGSNITITNGNGSVTIASTSGGGDVVGPASSTDSAIAFFSGTSGKLLKTSSTSDGNINGVEIGRGGGNIGTNVIAGAGMSSNTTGARITSFGWGALLNNTTGSASTGVGYAALFSQTTGNDNTACGDSALAFLTTGSNNTAVGELCLANITTGSQNSALGSFVVPGAGGRTNCSFVGYLTTVTGNDQIQLGNSSTTTYVYGTVQNRSDLRDKADIRDTQLGLNFITALRPVDYKWDMREDYRPKPPKHSDFTTKEEFDAAVNQWVSLENNNISNISHNGTHKRNRYHHGLIAQEVKQVLDAQGIDFGGYQDHTINGGEDVLSIGYDELLAPMIKAIQELKAELDSVKAELAALKAN